MKKHQIIALLLLLSSGIGYMEWGGGKMKQLIFQVETEVLSKMLDDPMSVLHPFTILPLIGQILLLMSIFIFDKKLIISGICCIGILFVLLFIIGILGTNIKMISSTLPFLGLSIYYLVIARKQKSIPPSSEIE